MDLRIEFEYRLTDFVGTLSCSSQIISNGSTGVKTTIRQRLALITTPGYCAVFGTTRGRSGILLDGCAVFGRAVMLVADVSLDGCVVLGRVVMLEAETLPPGRSV